MLAFGNRHFAPEGESVAIVDAKTGAPAEPLLVDRLTGRPLASSEFDLAPGPAATEATKARLRGARRKTAHTRHLNAKQHGGRDVNAPLLAIAPARPEKPPAAMSARTLLLLNGPIVPTLLRLAWPNVLVMLAQASTGVIETFWVSRLGTDALAGMALVFPGFMMMTMLSAGAVGGGIASAVARALGSGRRADADALVLHALMINVALGLATSALFLVFGRQLYAAMGGRGGSLDAAMAYSNVVFAGNIVLWLMNALASVIRGTGNMLFPSTVVCIGVVLLVPLSPLFIFGLGPFPAMGIAGGGVAVVATTALMAVILAWYVLSKNSIVRFRLARLKTAFFADILRVGGVGSLSTLQTTLTVALTTGLVGAAARSGRGRRLRNRLAARISPDPAGVRARRAAGRAGRHEYRRRPEPSRLAHRDGRRGAGLRRLRDDRRRRGDLALGVAEALRRQSGDDRDRLSVSALRRPDLRVLRPGARALFRLPGRGKAHVAACSRASPGWSSPSAAAGSRSS